ncbi:MAG TPA: hypothetical protein PLC40_16875, partial [Candidatus Hydrogenedentes bacterium]|nr:hypothetical protein [Candidatus Hydrogenedentota bacterium]
YTTCGRDAEKTARGDTPPVPRNFPVYGGDHTSSGVRRQLMQATAPKGYEYHWKTSMHQNNVF